MQALPIDFSPGVGVSVPTAILAACAATAAQAAVLAPEAAPPVVAVDEVEITIRRSVVGDLKEGVQTYRPEFFVAVRPGTAMDMIRWLPGFTFEDTRDLRGLGDAIGNVLIDGQPPTSKTDTLATVLSRIPASQVDHVDIIVGAAPGIDMRGRSVIANVVLKKVDQPKATLTLSDEQHAYGANAPELLVTASRKTGRSVSEVSLNVAQRVFHGAILGEGPLVRVDSDGRLLFAATENARAGGPMAVGTGSHEFPVQGGKLRLSGSYRVMWTDWETRTSAPGSGLIGSTDLSDKFTQAELGLRYERSFGRTGLEAQVLRRRNVAFGYTATRKPSIDTVLDKADTQDEAVARATLRFKRDETLTLEGSAEAARNTKVVIGDLLDHGVPAALPNANVSAGETRGELGALAAWKPAPTWDVTAAMKVETSTLSVRGDVDVDRRLTYWKPRLQLSWTPTKQTQWRLRAEREVEQLDFSDFVAFSEFITGTIRTGNPQVRPPQTWVGEAVWEQQFWTGASFVATVRFGALRDVIEVRFRDTDEDAVTLGNIGGGTQLRLNGTLTLPLSRVGLRNVSVKATLDYERLRVTDPTTRERRQMSYRSVWSGEAHLAHDLPGLKLNWGADLFYEGAFAAYHPKTLERSQALFRLSAFVEYRWSPSLNVRLEGANLLDPSPYNRLLIYTGARSRTPLDYAEERRLGEGRYVMLRVRKTLN